MNSAILEQRREALPDFQTYLEVPAVDNGESEATRRHRVEFRRFVFVKRNLDAGNARPGEKFVDIILPGLLIARAVGAEQYDAVTGPPRVIAIVPGTNAVEIHHRIEPTRRHTSRATGRRSAGVPR